MMRRGDRNLAIGVVTMVVFLLADMFWMLIASGFFDPVKK